VLVELARLTAVVEGLSRDSMRSAQETARDLADHEVRLRELEGHGTREHREQVKALEHRIADLLQWRSRVVGYALGLAAGGGVAGAGLVEGLLRLTSG
jgi:hypothetical protein